MVQNNTIHISGARAHNLKNINVSIPRNKLVVVTGVSGSGKSSLVIDTLFAEGQRKYVESLSSYARQFLLRMEKPDVDFIHGLSPAIAIDQHVSTATTRSTVGTMTEIYDYLRLLFAKIGKTYSPISNNLVQKYNTNDVLNHLFTFPLNTKVQILAPIKNIEEINIEALIQKGVRRLFIDHVTYNIDDTLPSQFNKAYALIDRTSIQNDEDNKHRLADSIDLAFLIGEGRCAIEIDKQNIVTFSSYLELDGIVFEVPTLQLFNYNSPQGACPICEGFGTIQGIDHNLVIPNRALSVFSDAIAPWRTDKMLAWKKDFINKAAKHNFPIHTPIAELSKEEYKLLWNGSKDFKGIKAFFNEVQSQNYKIQYRVLEAKYKGRTICDNCEGSRLKPEANFVKISDTTISSCVMMSIKELHNWVFSLQLEDTDLQISKRILEELKVRLQTMKEVGLEYLNLNRFSNTLSGGETQRIHLTRTLGSNLTDALYILDEPSIGLHSHDTNRLIGILKHLRDLGNTVIVVEHDEDIIREADYLIDIGPEAGNLGGEVVFEGKYTDIAKGEKSLTLDYLQQRKKIELSTYKRTLNNFITLNGVTKNNIKSLDVKIPLNAFSVITGVSGSGKTTLIKDVLYPALKTKIDGFGPNPGQFSELSFNYKLLHRVEFIDQNPIGRSSRSNPATYVKAYDAIRDLFSKQNLSKLRGYTSSNFSFNTEGGRCESCAGEGEQIVEMQFLADVHLVCEDCGGKRFKYDILEVKYKEKNIADVLDMTVDEAIEFFENQTDLQKKLKPLQDVGLGYVHLGQSSSTLSGGEAQRIKLASFLQKNLLSIPTLFIFDEPTTGLHFHDIKKLLKSFQLLIENGNTIIVIEHQLDIVKNADWIIDLGPSGGDDGGKLMFQGKLMDFLEVENNLTAMHLRAKLKTDGFI
jgi:excinuclease ABC subunit A